MLIHLLHFCGVPFVLSSHLLPHDPILLAHCCQIRDLGVGACIGHRLLLNPVPYLCRTRRFCLRTVYVNHHKRLRDAVNFLNSFHQCWLFLFSFGWNGTFQGYFLAGLFSICFNLCRGSYFRGNRLILEGKNIRIRHLSFRQPLFISQ